ncbi:MAG TPA: hypothetical protein DCL41_01020 [Bdellovibrionales bacterium]|nr:hypothetical protein [Pseudobdellovibrionaceae bacterium]HAG90419.1 hypothetical protein [Bdellovibrionales bacterium]|tara:strand:- start:190 stop:828 length:639 start_codon:yes stop_codon:yes gene_type:complete
MKHSIKVGIIAGLSIGALAFAKTNVKEALSQLKENEVNAKDNLKQYEVNREISKKNAEEVTSAIKELRAQRKALGENSQNLEKNRAILDAMKKKIVVFKKQEQDLLKTEEAQKAQLQALIDKLESNRLKREQNIAAYDQKIVEIENEKQNWDRQKSEMVAIHEEINAKEKVALKEREKWINKYKGYGSEAKKWDRQAASAEETRVKFEQLNK